MHERDQDMLQALMKAVYSSGDSCCRELAEDIRLGAVSDNLRELTARGKLAAKPLDIDLRDPNPQTLPDPAVTPGWPHSIESAAA